MKGIVFLKKTLFTGNQESLADKKNNNQVTSLIICKFAKKIESEQAPINLKK